MFWYFGLSPRGRGSPSRYQTAAISCGSIPAWAGEPAVLPRALLLRRVYPRVGGGAGGPSKGTAPSTGLSPRGRGSHQCLLFSGQPEGSIPAWAGEPAVLPRALLHRRVYPRVGGGATNAFSLVGSQKGLSPRGRGSRGRREKRAFDRGSIPAWAGEPVSSAAVRRLDRVYPRVGGGAALVRCACLIVPGLSPRGRGSPGRPALPVGLIGSIPAWAGEPV